MRLKFTELWDEEKGTGGLSVRLQINSAYYGEWTVNGSISINGRQLATAAKTEKAAQWADAICLDLSTEGQKSVVLSVEKAGYPRFALVNNANPGVFVYLEDAAAWKHPLHENEPGAAVYIGGEAYDCLIGNGSTYDRYTVKIGSGTAWD